MLTTRITPTFRAVAARTVVRPAGHVFARGLATGRLLDVAEEIKIDHDNVRDLFEKFKQVGTDMDKKGLLANTLIREMAVHSDAEEISVYNSYPEAGLGDVAEHNRDEHAEVKKLVYQADSTAIADPNYDSVMAKAVTAFLSHAEEEERDQLKQLKSRLSPEENDKIARTFLKAREWAPTRPHPWAPQTGGVAQKAAAMQGRLHDKIVETLGQRKFVDESELKYKHPETF